MPDVYVTVSDGCPAQTEFSFRMVRDRTFREYSVAIGTLDGNTLPDLLLAKAQQKPCVYFYDIGCGEGNVTHDLFEIVAERAEDQKLERDIVNRIKYIGIDKQSGTSWHDSVRTTFYEGDIFDVIANKRLPPIDMGVCHEVMSYIDQKLECIAALVNKLNRGDPERGLLLVKPFYADQILFSDTSRKSIVPIYKVFTGCVEIQYTDNLLSLQPPKQGQKVAIKFQFRESAPDFWQFCKSHIVGRPGQRISYYTSI